MKRRTFLTNLAATAALPMMPLKALAGAAPAAAAASMEQPYLWASFITRVHNNASPSMLQRLLKLDEGMAKQVYSELLKNNVITTPNAYGLSQAVNPFPQPGMAHMQSQISQQVVKISDKSLKLNTSDDENQSDDDSLTVNQEVTALEDEHIVNESPATTLTQTNRLNWLRLIRSRRVGPATFFRLLDEHGTAEAALDYLPQIARDAGVSSYSTFSHKAAYDELTNGTAMGLKLICFADPEYPELLRHIPDPPPILWAMGDVALLNRPTIAIVGARNASSLGTRMTRKIVTDLGAEGFVIASGLARGIDAAAHTAALPTGTIAVQAGGVDVVYPRENAALHDDIAAQGVRISENALGLIPQARHFPQRNRIIAGVAQATLVVEGAIRSGSLITARDAIDLGRDVMAIPGNPMDPRRWLQRPHPRRGNAHPLRTRRYRRSRPTRHNRARRIKTKNTPLHATRSNHYENPHTPRPYCHSRGQLDPRRWPPRVRNNIASNDPRT